MDATQTTQPSFSRGRRWLGVLNAALLAVAVLALVIMANYLAGGWFQRFHWSRDASFQLSSQTRSVLDTLTNDVRITIFFDPRGGNQEVYGLTASLLAEYQNANQRHVHVIPLDYTRLPGDAKELLAKYNLTTSRDKDFVLFDSNGHSKVVAARELADYDPSEILAGKSGFIRRSGFLGEMLFTSSIYAVSYPQPLKAYFLIGHGENDPGIPGAAPETTRPSAYTRFAAILKEEVGCDWDRLSLQGSNTVPADCQLLIVAGPRAKQFLPGELEKIAAYLRQGGRLLALLDEPCGLDPLLAAEWGARLGTGHIRELDKEYSLTEGGNEFMTATLGAHPIVNPFYKDRIGIVMIAPRPVFPVGGGDKTPGAPELTVLASTSKNGVDQDNRAGEFGLLAAIERGVVKGVETPRAGGTRIVLAGDSEFLDDGVIDSGLGNHAFARQSLNWLLQRPQMLLSDLHVQPIREYKLYMTKGQLTAVQWLFLAAMPGAVLALGAMVWLRRRH